MAGPSPEGVSSKIKARGNGPLAGMSRRAVESLGEIVASLPPREPATVRPTVRAALDLAAAGQRAAERHLVGVLQIPPNG